MRAAVTEGPNQPFVIRDISIAEPGQQEVLVRTGAVGLCHSDLYFMLGDRGMPFPGVLGHEVAGVVERVGSAVTGLAPGDHVVGVLTPYCGHCANCVSGYEVHCSDSSVKQPFGQAERLYDAKGKIAQIMNISGFAEQILVHYSSLVRIPKEMPLDRAALLGCAVLTGTGAVFRTAAIEPGSTVAVIGCGGVGLSTINGAAIAGAGRIIAIDLSDSKLEMARGFGATDTINNSKVDTVAAVRELTRGGVKYSFECIGLPSTTRQAVEMLAVAGTATVIGVFREGAEVSFTAELLLGHRKVQGSLMGTSKLPVDIPRLVDHYLGGRLLLDQLISKRISLDEINEGFEDMKRGDVARSVIVFPGVGD